LNRIQRLENLSKAFEVKKEYYKGKTILIIDDICTTGSTFEEMIKEFNNNGIVDIVCFATSTPV
jgi:predicted amidophosphoribosyltransferase